jgi:hypothetical protein
MGQAIVFSCFPWKSGTCRQIRPLQKPGQSKVQTQSDSFYHKHITEWARLVDRFRLRDQLVFWHEVQRFTVATKQVVHQGQADVRLGYCLGGRAQGEKRLVDECRVWVRREEGWQEAGPCPWWGEDQHLLLSTAVQQVVDGNTAGPCRGIRFEYERNSYIST